jgi:hypothetical protein
MMFKNLVLISYKTQHAYVTNISLLMLFRKIITICYENHVEPVKYILWAKCRVTDS